MSSQLNTSGGEVKKKFKTFTVGRIFLYFFGGLLLIVFSLIGWRVWHYYRLIKTGQIIDIQNYAFSSASKINAGQIERQNLASENAPSLGSPDAKITIVEFADFQCPYSKEVFTTMREFVEKNKDKVRLIFRHFPLTEIYPEALISAEASRCANEQDKFWAMHDKLFQNQNQLQTEDLKNYADQIGLDRQKFDECLDSHKYRNDILADYQAGFKAGVAGTPTFFINGRRALGAIPLFEWEKLLEK